MYIYGTSRKGRPQQQPNSGPDVSNPWLHQFTGIGPASRAVIELAVNGAITLCTETLGYVHTISLRWALQRQGRLHFSSNLRLFTQASNSAANVWYVNTASGIALILTYAAGSQIFLVTADPSWYSPKAGGRVMVNGIAILVTGLSLLVQAGIAHLCFLGQDVRIPTWSSNVLTITLASLHNVPHFRRHNRRCMSPASSRQTRDEAASRPSAVQPSLRKTDSSTVYVLVLVWLLGPAVIAWAAGTAVTALKRFPEGLTAIYLTKSAVGSLLYGILLISAMQAVATLGLHSVELLVNRSRDEVTWRHAYSSPCSLGSRQTAVYAPKAYNSVKAAATSWQSVGLYILKPIVHWLFGNSISELYGDGTGYVFGVMSPPYTVALAAGAFVVAAFATILTLHRPKGPMPSAWGHIHTLADLIDEWGDGKVERLYWGDKGENPESGIRHAGTSGDVTDLGEIRMDALYEGRR
ncbi:hypothetical protein LTR56_027095 [Elasticomyces elasticus]|nr:hypothetical protein LTR56_027095 [Elasticomyces elasticus]KAK3615596.1 hypothetical protein LTR22_027372 [Elasticomyces elasticus]